MNLPGRIAVLGGYGRFGARFCRALAKSGHGELCIAGRRLDRARRLAQTLEAEYPGSRVSAVELDHQDPRFVRHLGRIAPIVVVHTAGPFQAQDYTVAEACLACRSHYLDLADGRRFVAGFARFDREAQRRDVLLVSGASTLPGVSSAVVNELKHGMSSLVSIETSIVPANRTLRGEATIAAVLSYCGKPFKVFEDGAWIDRFGWQDSRSIRYPFFARRVAACDVPDLELFPEHYAGIETVTFHAGPELVWQHFGLRLMAALARIGIVHDWSRYARFVSRVDESTKHFGSDAGAMRVRVRGRSESGEPITRAWDLIAKQNHGPEIPCAPAIVLARKLLAGAIAERGAKACLGLVGLDDIARVLADFDIDWQVHEETLSC